MIEAYLTFCKIIYGYYIKVEGRGNGERFTTLLVTTIILSFNIGSVIGLILYYTQPVWFFDKYLVIPFMVIIGIVNFILFIRRTDLYENIQVSKKHKINALLYIILSFVFIAAVSKLHHDRNVNYKNQHQIQNGIANI